MAKVLNFYLNDQETGVAEFGDVVLIVHRGSDPGRPDAKTGGGTRRPDKPDPPTDIYKLPAFEAPYVAYLDGPADPIEFEQLANGLPARPESTIVVRVRTGRTATGGSMLQLGPLLDGLRRSVGDADIHIQADDG